MRENLPINHVLLLAIKKPQSAIRFGRFLLQNYLLMTYIKIKSMKSISNPGKVSIITPTYKRHDCLKEAIDSVQQQTYNDYEHIIISDGFDKYLKKLITSFGDDRITYLNTYKLNVKGNYQRNYGLLKATGEYILYLDDDNIIFPNALEDMVGGFSSKSIGWVIAQIMYGDNIMAPRYPFEYGHIDLLNYMIRRSLVLRVWGQCMHDGADFLLINDIAKISSGSYVDKVIGIHR